MSNEPDKIIYSMIRVTKRQGQREVLKDISLSYFYGAKIGVLGLNGAGKSSLLKILAGVDQAFDGKTVLAPGYTIGYLEQEPLANETRTVREVVEEGVASLTAIAREFEEINAKFAEPMSGEQQEGCVPPVRSTLRPVCSALSEAREACQAAGRVFTVFCLPGNTMTVAVAQYTAF